MGYPQKIMVDFYFESPNKEMDLSDLLSIFTNFVGNHVPWLEIINVEGNEVVKVKEIENEIGDS